MPWRTQRSSLTFLDMTKYVVDTLAKNYPRVKKGVETYMGDKVLDYEAKRILMKGKAEGIAEGEASGTIKTQNRMVQLIGILTDNNDFVTLKNISKDPKLLEELYKKYNI